MKRILTAFIFFLLIFSLTACATTPPQGPLTITDDKDREVTLARPAQRIVSIAPSNTEFLFALNLSEKVVGVTDLCNYPLEAAEKESIGDFANPSVEKILSLQPDLVLASSMHQEVVESLEGLEIAVMVLDAQNIDEIKGNIEMLAVMTDSQAAAESLLQNINSDLALVDQKIATISDEEKKSVYFEVWSEPIMTIGPNTFIHELITRAGGNNIAYDSQVDWPEFSLEQLIARQPEVMIYAHGAETVDAISNRPGWESIPAVSEGRIHLIDGDLVLRPGPRIIKGVIELSKILYPELWN